MGDLRNPLPGETHWENLVDRRIKQNNEALKMFRQVTTNKTLLIELNNRVEYLVSARHDYPIWPIHGVPSDAFERAEFEPIRHNYYRETIFLIRILRLLRKVA